MNTTEGLQMDMMMDYKKLTGSGDNTQTWVCELCVCACVCVCVPACVSVSESGYGVLCAEPHHSITKASA